MPTERKRTKGTSKQTALAVVESGAMMPYMANTLDKMADEFGSAGKFVDACRMSTVPAVMNFVRLFDHYKHTSKGGPSLDDICAKADLTPVKLVTYLVPALYEWGGAVGKLLHAINQPTLMKTSIETAKIVGTEGFGDRKQLLEAAGLIKSSSGPVFNNFNIQGTGDLPSFEDTVIDVTPALPAIEEEDVQPESQ